MPRPHADSRALQLDGTGRLLNANDGGIYRFAAGAWTNLNGNGAINQGLRITELLSVAYDPLNDIIFGGAQDNTTFQQQLAASNGVDDNLDGRIDDILERVDGISNSRFGGDGQTVLMVPVDLNADGHLDQIIRLVLGNNLLWFDAITYDANGAFVSNTRPRFRQIGSLVNFSGLMGWDNTTFTQGFTQIPFVLNAVDSTKTAIGLGWVYESSDQFSHVQAPINVGAPNVISALAYGGTKDGHTHSDVLYAASANTVFVHLPALSTDAVAPLLPTAAAGYRAEVIAGATRITDIALDPRNYDIAYATTDAGVYRRSCDAVTHVCTWALISQNLFNTTLTTVAFIPQEQLRFESPADAKDVLLVGGALGVSRALGPFTGAVSWLSLGRGLPGTLVDDLVFTNYDAVALQNRHLAGSDVLLVGTQGRGAWTLDGAEISLGQDPVLTYTGSNLAETILIERNASIASQLDVSVNGSKVFSAPILSLRAIVIQGNGGNDTLTVDSTNGPIFLPGGVSFTGGAGNDTLVLTGGKVHSVGDNTAGAIRTFTVEDTRGGSTEIVRFEDWTPADDTFTNSPRPATLVGLGPNLQSA